MPIQLVVLYKSYQIGLGMPVQPFVKPSLQVVSDKRCFHLIVSVEDPAALCCVGMLWGRGVKYWCHFILKPAVGVVSLEKG